MPGTLKPFLGHAPKTEHFDKWYGVQAHWDKVPKYAALGLGFLFILSRI